MPTIKTWKADEERHVLIGMLVDKAVTARVAGVWDKNGLFASPYANLIAGWAVDYHTRYNGAPGPRITGMFDSWVNRRKRDKETVALVERFLGGLSDQYRSLKTQSNTQYVLDMAGSYFNRVRLRRLAEGIQGDLDSGDETAAEARLNQSPIALTGQAGVDITDVAVIQQAFEEDQESMILLPKPMADFYGNSLARDSFIGVMAPEKRGKTWTLLDYAWYAMFSRLRTAFFSVGDMSQNQLMRRIMVRAARQPLRPRTIRYPTAISLDPGDEMAAVEHEEREFEQALTWQAAHKALMKLIEKRVRTTQSLIRISTHPNSSINVAGIRGIIDGWDRGGWLPDVVIIDYADILAPPAGMADTRDQINGTWKQLRALSQQLHGLVITATQADAASYGSALLGRHNFSDDKRKYAHVTGMVGINATPLETPLGLSRLNWLVIREEEFHGSRCLHRAGCLSIGNPGVRTVY